MSWLQRWTPWLVTGLGVVHFGYALTAEEVKAWQDIVADGVLAGVNEGGADYFPRVFALYFTVLGFFLLAAGGVARWTLARTGQIPPQIGWYLTVAGAMLSIVEFPVTGGWAVLILGVMMVIAARPARVPAEPDDGRN